MSIGIAAGVAAFAATAVLALTHSGGAGSGQLPLAALSTLAPLRPIEAVGPPGPEEVPIPDAPVLARPLRLRIGKRIDGIACEAGEQVLFHIHAHLTIFVHGAARRVPAGIGIAPPYEVQDTPAGAFVVGAPCFMWLHTHSADGVIHTESPIRRAYMLGDFFDIWGQRLDRQHVGRARGPVTALLNGRVFTGNPRRIPLLAHAQIQIEVGKPLIAPETISFPNGLWLVGRRSEVLPCGWRRPRRRRIEAKTASSHSRPPAGARYGRETVNWPIHNSATECLR